jgi:uncharacterized membrane protein YcgQ (UPF0703/DUF1980 family)
VVLLFPLVLFFLFPAQSFSGEGTGIDMSQLDAGKNVEIKEGYAQEIGFSQLEMAAMSLESRNYFEGRLVKLTGMFVGEGEKQFTMTRYKMNCCAADALPLRAVIMLDKDAKELLPSKQLKNKWVEVTGRIQFLGRKDKNAFIPALIVYPTEKEPLASLIVEIAMPANPYAN